jgi:hypothetical protein
VAISLLAPVVGCDRSASVDGQLDCVTKSTWIGTAAVPEDTVGSASPESAMEEALDPYLIRRGGEIVQVDERLGSLVVDGREAVVVTVSEAPAGGWIVLTTAGCEEFES